MKISVVICTHNRAQSLKRTLHSLTTQTLPHSEFEVIVVDNASTDDTQTVVTSFADLPVRYIFESSVGLSIARNTGWQNAHNPYVVFIDDDAEADPVWLESILKTFAARVDQAVVVGGKVELVFPVQKPAWLEESLLFCLGNIDVGPGTIILDTTPFYLPGCNLAVSKQTLLDHGGFPTLLGRKGDNLLSGEEILLQQKIKAAGGSRIYTEAAQVKHHVERSRLTKKWFLKRMYWEGVTNKKIEKMMGHHISLATELAAFLRQVFSFGFIFKASFADMCLALQRFGRVVESVRPR